MKWISIVMLVLVLSACLLWLWLRQAGMEAMAPVHADAPDSLRMSGSSDAILHESRLNEGLEDPQPEVVDGNDIESGEFELRSQTFDIPFRIRDVGTAFLQGEKSSLSFPLFDGDMVVIAIKDYRSPNALTDSLLGQVQGQELSHVVITQYEGAWAGTIQMPEAGLFYEIRNGSVPGTYDLLQVDPGVIKLSDPVLRPGVTPVPLTTDESIP
jgi:hypothetical protein